MDLSWWREISAATQNRLNRRPSEPKFGNFVLELYLKVQSLSWHRNRST